MKGNTSIENCQGNAKFSHEIIALEYFAEHDNTATVRELFDLGINSPTKLISNLRRKGYAISGERTDGQNRYGVPVKFITYHLEGYANA